MNREPLHPITEAEVAAYARDGAVALRQVFDPDWIALLGEGVEENLSAPGPYARHYTKDGESGHFVGDYCNWQRIPEYRDFVWDSPAAALVARLMGSDQVNFFHEHVLVKEPGTAERTPWHHDQPYWCVDGAQVCSIWLPLDPVPRALCVEFVAGSHLWGRWFKPRLFVDHTDYDYPEGWESVPHIEARRDAYRILSWDLEPGDAIAFHALTLHGAPGNPSAGRRRAFATRWTGDDARYARRPGRLSPPFPEMGVALRPGDPMDCETFPVVWPRAQAP